MIQCRFDYFLIDPRRRTLQPQPLWSRVRRSPTPASPQTYTEFGGYKAGKPGGITPQTRYMLSLRSRSTQAKWHWAMITGLAPGNRGLIWRDAVALEQGLSEAVKRGNQHIGGISGADHLDPRIAKLPIEAECGAIGKTFKNRPPQLAV
jgi:hypothetical protein